MTLFTLCLCLGFVSCCFFKPLFIETCVGYFHFALKVLIVDEVFFPESSSSLVSYLLPLLFSF